MKKGIIILLVAILMIALGATAWMQGRNADIPAADEVLSQTTEVPAADEVLTQTTEMPAADEGQAETTETPAADEISTETDETAEEKLWWNILFLGGDSRTEGGYRLTDSMMIVSINREECLVKLTSVMRDTWVKFPGTKRENKINAANVYGGPELAMETVNEYFGTDIEDYVMINMPDMVRIIDLVGGIDLEISSSERVYINRASQSYLTEIGDYSGETYLAQSGEVHLNGLQAVAYSRDRSSDSDYGRVMRQQKVLLALAEVMQNMEVNELMESVDQIMELVQTNLETEEMKQLSTTGLAVEIADIMQFRVPVDGTFTSGTVDDIWRIMPNFEKNQELLRQFIYEQQPQTEE